MVFRPFFSFTTSLHKMELTDLVNVLESALKGPLPGRLGQQEMAPLPLEEARFDRFRMEHARKGAVLLLICPSTTGVQIPFIKRASYAGVHSGQIALPGGKMEPDDHDLRITAVRETEEEIGVDRRKIQLLGALSDLYIPPSNFYIRPFIGFTSEVPLFKPDAREVERLICSDFDALIDERNKKRKSFPIPSGGEIMAPYFEIDREVVWGATAMILSEFLLLWKNRGNGD